MKKRNQFGTILTLLVLLVIAWYLTVHGRSLQQAEEPAQSESARKGTVHAWPIPSEETLAKLKAEKGMKVSESTLKKMQSATVQRVVDGDTVELKIGSKVEKVRMLNVNTPETVDPRRPVEEYGKEASNFTRSVLSPGTRVYLKTDVEERDQYGRLLLHIYLEDGTWFNALLVRAGYAQVMTVPPNVSAASFFKELQAKAREERIGLWQIPAYRNPPKQ